MVYVVNGYKCYRVIRERYWFAREIPEGAEPIEELPEGYELVMKARNKYPFLKKIKTE